MDETSRRNILKTLGVVGPAIASAGCTGMAQYVVNGRTCPGYEKSSFEVNHEQGVEIDGIEFYGSEDGGDLVYVQDGETQTVDELEPGQKVDISEELEFTVESVNGEEIGLSSEEGKDYCLVDRQ